MYDKRFDYDSAHSRASPTKPLVTRPSRAFATGQLRLINRPILFLRQIKSHITEETVLINVLMKIKEY